MSSLRRFVAVAVVALAFAACGDEGGDPTGATCTPAGMQTTWESFGNQFFAFYCRDCHSNTKSGSDREDAPADVNFDQLVDVQGRADDIDRWAAAGPAAVNTSMPPKDPKPSEAERQQLAEWLACGAQ